MSATTISMRCGIRERFRPAVDGQLIMAEGRAALSAPVSRKPPPAPVVVFARAARCYNVRHEPDCPNTATGARAQPRPVPRRRDGARAQGIRGQGTSADPPARGGVPGDRRCRSPGDRGLRGAGPHGPARRAAGADFHLPGHRCPGRCRHRAPLREPQRVLSCRQPRAAPAVPACERCGSVAEVDGAKVFAAIDRTAEAASFAASAAKGPVVEVWGLCANCAGKDATYAGA